MYILAMNMSLVLLRRDAFNSEVYKFRNRTDHLIVIYHQDENKTAKECARLFVEKGFTNVRLLTGGIVGFFERFPDRVSGLVPLPQTASRTHTAKSRATSGMGDSKRLTGTGRLSPRSVIAASQRQSRLNGGRNTSKTINSSRSTAGRANYSGLNSSTRSISGDSAFSVRSNATSERAWR